MDKVHGAIYSVLTAGELENTIKYAERDHPDDFFNLEMVTYRPGEEVPEVALPPLFVAVQTKSRMTRLADGVEIIHCVSDGGRAVDIELGGEAGREIRPARVRVQQ